MSYDDDLDNMILAMVDAPSSTSPSRHSRYVINNTLHSYNDSDDLDIARDRDYLESLPELEREAILAERAEQRQKLEERRALKQKLREQRESHYPSTRSSVLDKKRKMQALKDKHGARRGGNRYSSSDSEYEPESSSKRPRNDGLEDDRDGDRRERKDRHSPSSGNNYSPTWNPDRRQGGASPLSRGIHRDPPIDYDGLLAMQLTRDQIEKFCYADFFDDLARDAVVRLRVGDHNGQPVYRVVQVIEVTEYKRVYTIHRVRTNKAFRMKHSAAERVFLADIFSNSPFTKTEYQRWRGTCESESVPLPTVGESKRKAEEIARAEAHHFTEEEIAQILKKKRALRGSMPRNLAAEKAELIKKKQIAEGAGDEVLVSEIDRQLEDLEETIAEQLRNVNPMSETPENGSNRSGSGSNLSAKKKIITTSMLASSMGNKNIFKQPNTPVVITGASSSSIITPLPTFSLDVPPLPPLDTAEEELSITDLFTKGPKVDINLDI